MKIIISYDIKYKTRKEKIENILRHYGMKKIQETLYIGKLEKDEKKKLNQKLKETTKEKDSILIIPICKNCYDKKTQHGKEIKFKEDLYRVY